MDWSLAALVGLLVGPVREELRPPPPPPAAPPPALSSLEVALKVPAAEGSHRYRIEAAAHVSWLLELGLMELRGVVPARQLDGVRRVAPGLVDALPAGAPWTLALDVAAEEVELTAVATLCDPAGLCTVHDVEGRREAPWSVADLLLAQLAARLGRPLLVPGGALGGVETSDPYAALLTGRAAAVWFGMLPPTAEADIGDVRRDPVARAVYLDPAQPSAWAVAARVRQDPAAAAEAAGFAAAARPQSVALRADHAALLERAGSAARALALWRAVDVDAPGDPRFVVSRARALIAAGEVDRAAAGLAEVPATMWDTAPVVRVRVAVAAARGALDDALLVTWAQADPSDPEPVRRRVAVAVREVRVDDALALTADLAQRGAAEEARRLVVALAAELGRYAEAATAADALGSGALAA